MNSKLIYISSPYAGDVELNVGFAQDACRYCIMQGHTPVAVHLLYPQLLDDNVPEQRRLGLQLGNHVLTKCDELWVCGDRLSNGMSAEIDLALQLGIPIRDVPEVEIVQAVRLGDDIQADILLDSQ